MKKKLVGVLLTMAMTASLLAGCGGASSSGDTQEKTKAESGTGADSVLKDGDMTELVLVKSGANASPADMQAVEDAMNEIIGETVDAKIKLQIIEFGAYDDQVNLMLSSGEKMDLVFSTDDIAGKAKRGQLYPITDLVDVYAKEAVEFLGDYLDASYFDGELYGLPAYRDMADQKGLVCRADLLEEMGFKKEDIKTFDDVEKVLSKAKETYPDMYPLLPFTLNEGCFMHYITGEFDVITSGVGCDMDDDPSDGIEIINEYATDEYREMAQKAYEWRQKGYFMPDATTNSNTVESMLAADKGFGYYGNAHPGVVTQVTSNCGKEIAVIPIGRRTLTTTYVNFIEWLVPAQCENPEKAVAVLNLLYSNPELHNLFHYGIEGVDYEFKDKEKGIVGYPEGVDSSSVGWVNDAWMTGNPSIGYVWETDPEDVWEQYEEFNRTAEPSPMYGFIYDSSSVKNEVSAVSNVVGKYKAVIENGDADPDTTVDKFNAELKSAGIDNIIEDMQKQVDEWLASK